MLLKRTWINCEVLSTFTAEGSLKEKNTWDLISGGGSLIRIIIVSDVRFVREALGEILARDESLSIVGVAADLDEARVMCRNRQPNVVLLDAAMPDGLAAVGQIR